MEITEAKFEAGWLCLKVPTTEAMRLLYRWKPGTYELKKAKSVRSLNANAYAWMLMGKIASKLNIPTDEIYRGQIEAIGGKSAVVSLILEAVEDFNAAFIAGHIGRKTELIGVHGDIADVLITYGSSDYDTRQMSQLINNIVQDCHELGIETLEDEDLKSLVTEWGKTHGQ